MELDLDNREFKLAFNLIQNTNKTFFLTGKAGTGKSTFLKYFVKTIKKKFIVVAPTGIAAINSGGVTIHSFFQFPPRPFLPKDTGITIFGQHSDRRRIIECLDTLFIDEASMVRADLLSAIDCSLRRNGGNPKLPFGGKQLVFVGDVFQIPPVMPREKAEQKIIHEFYRSPYFFNTEMFEKNRLLTVELKKVYRQADPVFISLLDRIRTAEIRQSDLDMINNTVISKENLENQEYAITLTTRNDKAFEVNSSKLGRLQKKEYTYKAEITGEFEYSNYPTDTELRLKVGAQVIFIMNDKFKLWVNGTIGLVVRLSKSRIRVKLEDGTICNVGRECWQNVKYKYNREKKMIEEDVIGTFEHYPLKLAWAITVHKSQGLTFEKVIVDFGTGTFASGQAYVALSRVTSINGLHLQQKLKISDVFVDNEIKKFAKSFTETTEIEEKLFNLNGLSQTSKDIITHRSNDFFR